MFRTRFSGRFGGRALLALVALGACLVVAPAVQAGHGGGGHSMGGHNMGGHHMSGPNMGSRRSAAFSGHAPHGPRSTRRSSHRAHSGHGHFGRGSHGWTHRRWFGRSNRWLYWCPDEGCWYCYSDDDGTYVPCDDLTDEDMSDD
jgi:hypothetical protein